MATKVLIAGDFCPQNRVAESFQERAFSPVLGEVKTIISEVDYSIVNFECPVIMGGERPITKQGPNLKCSEVGVEAVKWIGFDCVTLANNHFLDYGEEGANNTIEACTKYEIDTVGGGMNLAEASKVLYKDLDGIVLAIINCCEHEFSIATETSAGSNPLNPIKQYYAIQEAKKNADKILVIIHGGHEHFQLPSPRMVETYRFFIDAGADAVVNHHQHCFSGYELYKGKPIFYGLGNFCFDKPQFRDNIWNYGYMVIIDFTSDNTPKLIPYKQCCEKPSVSLLVNQSDFEVQIEKLNIIISDKNQLEKEIEKYYSKDSRFTRQLFEPYSSRLMVKLYLMHIIPSLLSNKKLISILNKIDCESHRDKLLYFLKQKN